MQWFLGITPANHPDETGPVSQGWGGQRDGLVIAVALVWWMRTSGPVRSKFNSESANLIIVVIPTPPVSVLLIVPA